MEKIHEIFNRMSQDTRYKEKMMNSNLQYMKFDELKNQCGKNWFLIVLSRS